MTSSLNHADHFKALLCWSAAAPTTPPCFTNWLSPLWTSLREKKIISNTQLCVCTSNTRGKLWLPELGGGQARVSLCAKETKALPLGPWTHTKHGAELANSGGTAEDNHSNHLTKELCCQQLWLTCGRRKRFRRKGCFMRNAPRWLNKLRKITVIYRGECWFNKFLPRGSKRWTHLDLPTFLFSMERTDLYFIGLHTWKKFTPYA